MKFPAHRKNGGGAKDFEVIRLRSVVPALISCLATCSDNNNYPLLIKYVNIREIRRQAIRTFD